MTVLTDTSSHKLMYSIDALEPKIHLELRRNQTYLGTKHIRFFDVSEDKNTMRKSI